MTDDGTLTVEPLTAELIAFGRIPHDTTARYAVVKRGSDKRLLVVRKIASDEGVAHSFALVYEAMGEGRYERTEPSRKP